MQCAPDSARWPLLHFDQETLFFDEAECLTLPHPIHYPANRASLLAQLEQDLARGRRVDRPFWNVPAGCDAFFAHVRQRAERAGGLRVYSNGASPPVEALALEAQSWAELFPIVRVGRPVEQPHGAAGDGVLIYCNPEGEDLPLARAEADEMLRRFSGRAQAFFRTLAREELDEQIRTSSLVFYFGHARLIEGHTAIPTATGWMPLLSRSSGPLSSRTFVLSACLEDGARFAGPGGLFIHPVSRLADRPSRFLQDLFDAWTAPGELSAAWLRACTLDCERGDIRRFIYRLQGNIWF
jgi:hypothetical protein